MITTLVISFVQKYILQDKYYFIYPVFYCKMTKEMLTNLDTKLIINYLINYYKLFKKCTTNSFLYLLKKLKVPFLISLLLTKF